MRVEPDGMSSFTLLVIRWFLFSVTLPNGFCGSVFCAPSLRGGTALRPTMDAGLAKCVVGCSFEHVFN
jgi:hypothetical protein